MNLSIILKVAFRSLRRTVVRSGLTMLGVVIGVASVVAMVSIGSGAKMQVEATLGGMDAHRIQIVAKIPSGKWRPGQPVWPAARDGLTLDDYAAITDIPAIDLANVQLSVLAGQVKGRGRASDTRVQGVDVDGIQMESRRFLEGTNFTAMDVERAAAVCIVTEYIAHYLFGRAGALGQRIQVNGAPLQIIGILEDGHGFKNTDQSQSNDTVVYLPYTSLLRRLDRNPNIMIVVKADDPEHLQQVKARITDLLESRRGRRRAEFAVSSVEEAVRSYKEGSRTMALLLGSVAAISLAVGGIGIMNIMLVSVTERTREIGIRLAIGTLSRDVMRQFLVEAVILSTIGGAIGIVVGVGVARLLTHINQWPTQITLTSVVGAFLCSAGVGVFFGYYPARRASNLDPIDALRME